MTTAKEILFEDAAREKLQRGLKQASEAVRFTLGPRGRNVGIESSFGEPKITSDGHTILQELELKDPFENMGVAMVKEAAAKMKEKCGDGTTTTTLLLDKMVQIGSKYVAAGASPIMIKRGMEKAIDAILDHLKKRAQQVENDEQIKRIAQVSASGDERIGLMIYEAICKVGRDGVITIDESKSTDSVLELVEGLQFDRGYISPYFINQAEKMIAEHTEPYLLITDRKISSIHELLPLLQSIAASSRALVIIADDVDAEALSTLVVNQLRGILKVAAVKAPGFGDRRKALLEDLAVVTGAQLITEDRGLQLKEVSLEQLGQAEKISITKDHTTIISGKGHQIQIDQRIRAIEREAESTTNKYDKEKLLERKAKLKGGVGVIRVGAPSEAALKNLKQRFEDSLNSTRAALEEGVVIGSGMALAYSAKVVSALELTGDEKLGGQIVQLACQFPSKQIIDNAGLDGNVTVTNLIKEQKEAYGFNALKGEVEDLLQQGVLDPAKVVMQALTHAAATACVILLSEALIIDAKEEI